MTRARITWPDGTTLLIDGTEASVTVFESGLVRIVHGNRQRFVPASSYKYVDLEGS